MMLLCLFSYFCIDCIIAQSITFINLTDITELTSMEPISSSYDPWISPVTTYVDMKSMKNYYWITTFRQKGVVSNIYDINKLIQYNHERNYNLSSSLPFEIADNGTAQLYDTIGQCKSPSNNNIITCYSDYSHYYNISTIKCTIFNDTDNTLSSQFIVSKPANNEKKTSRNPQILCKHDKYIILYTKFLEEDQPNIAYTALDIGGDILLRDVDLHLLAPNIYIYMEMRITSFNNSIFLITGLGGKILGWIGHYHENQNNDTFPINVMPQPSFTINVLIVSFDIITINVTNNCCFLMIYQFYWSVGVGTSMNASIIDSDGNILLQQMLLYSLSAPINIGSIVELQMINKNNSNSKYFLIANTSWPSHDAILGNVYRLSYDATSDNKYCLQFIKTVLLQWVPSGQTSARSAVLSNLNNQLLTITYYGNARIPPNMYAQIWNVTIN
eukprot:334594_1